MYLHDMQMKLSGDRQRLLAKVEASREEYACLKQQHLDELEEQARRLTVAKAVSYHDMAPGLKLVCTYYIQVLVVLGTGGGRDQCGSNC